MSNENSTPTNLEEIKEAQPKEETYQQLITEAKEEVKGGGKKSSTKAIRLATISRILDKHTTQMDKVGKMVQSLQNQMDRISKMVQPLQQQLKSMEKQTELFKQMQTQIKQLQKQVSQVQKENQKIRSLLLSNKKKNIPPTKSKNTKKRGTRRTK